MHELTDSVEWTVIMRRQYNEPKLSLYQFICDLCGVGFKRKEHLERHKLGHNPERPYICAVCCKGFKRKEHLNIHSVIHSDEKSEVCPECGKGFKRKDHLRKHARSHLAKRVKEEQVEVQIMVDPDTGLTTADGQVQQHVQQHQVQQQVQQVRQHHSPQQQQ